MYPFMTYKAAHTWEDQAKARGVSQVARSPRGFMRAYQRAGNKTNLPPDWHRKRDAFIKRHMAQVRMNDEQLWKDGKPSRRALALIMWAYMPPGRSRQNPLPTAGKRLSGYHGTYASFSGAPRASLPFGLHIGTEAAAKERLKHIKEQGNAKGKPSIHHVTAQASRLLSGVKDAGLWNSPQDVVYVLSEKLGRSSLSSPEIFGKNWFEFKRALEPGYKAELAAIESVVKDRGYDAISYRNAYEDKGKVSYILLGARIISHDKKAVDMKNPNILAGGKGDKLRPKDVNQRELKMGIKVEMEHTTSRALAKEIALDHLAEYPDYYTRLAKMEREAEKAMKKNPLTCKMTPAQIIEETRFNKKTGKRRPIKQRVAIAYAVKRKCKNPSPKKIVIHKTNRKNVFVYRHQVAGSGKRVVGISKGHITPLSPYFWADDPPSIFRDWMKEHALKLVGEWIW